MYFIYDENYLDENDDFNYVMSPCFESFEKAANYGIRKAIRADKKIVTLITDEGMIITFWNPHLEDPQEPGHKMGTINHTFKEYLPKWYKSYKKKEQLKDKIDPTDIPDVCPEFDVD